MIGRLPDPDRSRAVLIGTSEYIHPELTAIPGVAKNLTDLAGVLTSSLGAGLPREHCVVLPNPPAQDRLGEQIVRAAAEAEDVLLVYYAGHGEMTWDQTNELCLTLPGTMLPSLRTSALRCADLRHYIRNSRARIRVLILDCCFGGYAMADTLSSPTNTLLSEVDVAGAYVLAATFGRALAPATLRNTLFTGELLRLLHEGIASEPGMLLTMDALFREVKAVLHRNGQPEPCSNHSDTAASLALGHNAAHQVHKAFAATRSALEDLAAAEADTDLAYTTAIDKIAKPNLPRWAAAAPALLDRLDTLNRRAWNGHPPTTAELDLLGVELAAATSATLRLLELATGLVDWRNELRGKLEGYRAMAIRLRVPEDAEVAERYTVARDLLWTRPCELGAATRAVNAYQQSVIDRREARWAP